MVLSKVVSYEHVYPDTNKYMAPSKEKNKHLLYPKVINMLWLVQKIMEYIVKLRKLARNLYSPWCNSLRNLGTTDTVNITANQYIRGHAECAGSPVAIWSLAARPHER